MCLKQIETYDNVKLYRTATKKIYCYYVDGLIWPALLHGGLLALSFKRPSGAYGNTDFPSLSSAHLSTFCFLFFFQILLVQGCLFVNVFSFHFYYCTGMLRCLRKQRFVRALNCHGKRLSSPAYIFLKTNYMHVNMVGIVKPGISITCAKRD